MNNIDMFDRKEMLLKYVKYIFIIVFIICAFFFFFSKNNNSYNSIEKEMVRLAKEYVQKNNLNIIKDEYIEITKLDNIEGTELCSKASGVIVKNQNGKILYQSYLSCDDYKTKIIRNDEKYIVLNGDDVVLLNQGEIFDDPLYYLKSDARVEVINNFSTNKTGIYEVAYHAYVENKLKEIAYRKVIVSSNDRTETVMGVLNKNVPTITLHGEKNMFINVGSKYKEPGYLAADYEDGKITRKVKVSGMVDTSIAGVYIITYSVTNSQGRTALAIRKVTVIKQIANFNVIPNSTIANNKAQVSVTINGSDYSHTLLADGTRCISNVCSQEIRANGIYKLKVYDVFGNEFPYTFEIDELDTVAPTGNCEATVTNKKTIIEVNASDNKGIAGYSYIMDGLTTDYLTVKKYEHKSSSINVMVKVKDISNNVTVLNCNVIEKKVLSDMTPVALPTSSFPCGTDVTEYNRLLAAKVVDAGTKTRNAVVAAGTFLAADVGYRIEYFWAGKYAKIGLNPKWGCDDKIWAEGSGTPIGTVLPLGLDCTGYVKWAFVNAGFEPNIIPRSGMSVNNFGVVKPKTIYFSSNSKEIDDLLPGDLLWCEGHIALVLGVDDTKIKIGQAISRGVMVDFIDKTTGKSLTNSTDFEAYVLLEEFYQMYGD